jgi:hypothetical protein
LVALGTKSDDVVVWMEATRHGKGLIVAGSLEVERRLIDNLLELKPYRHSDSFKLCLLMPMLVL